MSNLVVALCIAAVAMTQPWSEATSWLLCVGVGLAVTVDIIRVVKVFGEQG